MFTKGSQQHARWTARGKERTAKVTGKNGAFRISIESETFYARITLQDGSRREVSTGCKTRSAANAVAARLAGEQEKIKAGVLTESELKTVEHGRRDYAETVGEFIDNMAARGCAESTRYDWKRYLLDAGQKGLGWRTIGDMNRPELERWLSMRAMTPRNPKDPDSVMGARVHNCHATAFSAFGTWCERQGYLKTNPFAKVLKRDEKADRRHIRRDLTPEELKRLIEAAWNRPEKAALRGNRGRGQNMLKAAAEVEPETLDRLRFLGRTRALAYWTAAATGLRWGELRSITLGAMRLDENPPHLILAAKDEKARRGANIPLQPELSEELEKYASERRSRLVGNLGAKVVAFPASLDKEPLFDVPKQMCRVFDLDLAAAGIPKHDGAGRVVDVHALRHTFGTMLAKANVSLQVAQKAMRHSTPALTANVYTHLGLLDIAGAVKKLPKMGPLPADSAQVASKSVAPNVAPKTENPCHFMAIPGNTGPVACFTATTGTEFISPNSIRGFHAGMMKKDGGRSRTRTADLLRVRQAL